MVIRKNYGYLALWDAIDCHLTFYLGLAAPTTLGLQNMHHGTAGVIVSDMVGGTLAMLFPAFLSIELLLMIFALAITIFLFSIIVYFTNLYIVAMLAVTILIFFGPFFVPMALFNYTRSMFDQWYKLLFGYALQPLVISGFIALFVTTFHYIFYTGCKFTPPASWSGLPYWVFDTTTMTSDGTLAICQKSFGYIMAQFNPTVALQRVAFGGGIFYYNTFAHNFSETIGTMLDGMMLCTFFAFLFYFFAEQLSGLAADLTGSMELGSVVSPNAITNLALKKLTSGVSKKIPGGNKQSEGRKRPNVQVGGSSGGGVQVGGSSGGGGVQVGGSSRGGGVQVGGSSGGGAQASNTQFSKAENRASFKEMPFANMGDVKGVNKGAEKESMADNRAAFKEMPFANMDDVGGKGSRADQKYDKKQLKAGRKAKAVAKNPDKAPRQ